LDFAPQKKKEKKRVFVFDQKQQTERAQKRRNREEI